MKKKKKLLTEQEQKEIAELRITTKGIAVVLAIENGLCPKIKGGYDITKFEKFWEAFESQVDLPKEEVSDSIKTEPHKRGNKRTNDSNTPIVPLILGILAGSIIGKLLFLLLKVLGVL